jgi:hypothetical protein
MLTIKINFVKNKNKLIRAFRNQCILGDTYGYWGSYSF